MGIRYYKSHQNNIDTNSLFLVSCLKIGRILGILNKSRPAKYSKALKQTLEQDKRNLKFGIVCSNDQRMILNVGTSLNPKFCHYCHLGIPTENNILLSSSVQDNLCKQDEVLVRSA